MSDDAKSKESILEQGSGEFKQYRLERPSHHKEMKHVLETRDFAEQKAKMDEATSASDLASAIGAAASAISNLDDEKVSSAADRAYEHYLKKHGPGQYNELHGTFEVEKTVGEKLAEEAVQSTTQVDKNVAEKHSDAAFERFNQQSANVSSVEYGNALGHGKSK